MSPALAPCFLALLTFALDTTVTIGRTAALVALSLFLNQDGYSTAQGPCGQKYGGDGAKRFSPCALQCVSAKKAQPLRQFNMASVQHVGGSCLSQLTIFLQLNKSTIAQTGMR